MSRTYRRTKGYIPEYVQAEFKPLNQLEVEKWVGAKWNYRTPFWFRCLNEVDGQWYWHTEKSAGRKVAMWFGDHGYAWRRLYGKDVSKFMRGHTQTKHRAYARMELKRFEKNEEHEVIIPRKRLLPWD
jgi:hypothetical protein